MSAPIDDNAYSDEFEERRRDVERLFGVDESTALEAVGAPARSTTGK
jgi:hypothetical protein